MLKLRDYQEKAVAGVNLMWETGDRCVCLVAPTGSGKTVMGQALAAQFAHPLWICHRRELVNQAQARLGPSVQVVTVQKLLRSGDRPTGDALILDECHHMVSEEWGKVAAHYDSQPVVGLTATPERSDGRPLGDMFSNMVVAATYSELIEAGHLVPARVFRPKESLPSGQLAKDPIDAYREHGNNGQGFLYVGRVPHAIEQAEIFNAAGIGTAAIVATTPKNERDEIFADFAAGGRQILSNVYTLTEGVDVPEASVCILARRCSHQSIFLQMAGRVLRPAPGKEVATVIDLSGITHIHGLPTEDRIYSLKGTAIRTKTQGVKDCPECGVVVLPHVLVCPECGYEWPPPDPEPEKPIFYDLELEEVYAGADTKRSAKQKEWSRLVNMCVNRDWGLYWALKEYRKLFPGERPQFTLEEKAYEYKNLIRFAAKKGYKRGWASHRYKGTFGVWPRGLGFDSEKYFDQCVREFNEPEEYPF